MKGINIYGMENVQIVSQERFAYVGNRKVEFFDVIADTKRFGKHEIMCQGTWKQCLDYLEENGIDYREECLKRNRGSDIQVGAKMYSITEETETYIRMRSRGGDDVRLEKNDWLPIAPNTFRITLDTITRWQSLICRDGKIAYESGHPYYSGYSLKYYTLKMMDAKAW